MRTEIKGRDGVKSKNSLAQSAASERRFLSNLAIVIVSARV